MGIRRTRRQRHAVSALPALSASVDNPPPGSYPGAPGGGGMLGGLTGYQGAQWDESRGYIYWPSLDPEREHGPFTRVEVARKAHFFVANTGLGRRMRRALTNLIVGAGLRPQGLTKDTEWNRLAEASYHARGSSPFTYDAGGSLTDTRSQRLMVGTALVDGDAAAVWARSDGGGTMRAFYSGLQVGNSSETQLDQSFWSDGVRLSGPARRPVQYRFPGANGSVSDVRAEDMVLYFRGENLGARRGVSVFAHAVNKMVDIAEVNAAVMRGIKEANRIGYYIGAESQAPPTKTAGDVARALIGPAKKVVAPDGKSFTLKTVYNDGGKIAELPPGYSIKTLLDQRPHPNSREFIEEVTRDVAWGADLSYELLWNIVKLGGANTRFVLQDAQVFVSTEQQDLVDYFLARDWVMHICAEMKAERLRPCQDPEFFKHGWVPPARMTVDFGRDGKLLLDYYQAGLITANRMFNLNGQDAREETLQHLDFIEWRKREMAKRNLTLAECYPTAAGSPAPPAGNSEDASTEEEKPDPEEEKDDLDPAKK